MMMGRVVRGVGSCGDKMCRTGRTGEVYGAGRGEEKHQHSGGSTTASSQHPAGPLSGGHSGVGSSSARNLSPCGPDEQGLQRL